MKRATLSGGLLCGILVLTGRCLAANPPPRVIVLQGRGAQIYACTQSEAAYAWHLEAPDAQLLDAGGHVIGRHFAGPSWQAQDGSTVVGKPVAAGEAPRQGAVAWLVVTAKSHSGKGLFAAVTYIVRSATEGGAAPAAGCDAAHAGAEQRVGYSATYTFFSD